MPVSKSDTSDMSGAQGCLRVMRTVLVLTAVTLFTAVNVHDQAAAGFRARLMQNATSFAVTGAPFWNLIPLRKWNVYTVPPLDIDQLVARSGMMSFPLGATWTRRS